MSLALHGYGIGDGIAIGRALVMQRAKPLIPNYAISALEVDVECRRFELAVAQVRGQLGQLRRQLPPSAPVEIGTLIGAHLLMLDDPLLVEQPAQHISDHLINAEQALERQAQSLVAVFDSMEDSYLRSKRNDIEQVVARIQNVLMGVEEATPAHDPSSDTAQILVSEDLSPADAALLRDKHVGGFITNLGGPVSHTAILARSLNIPAVVGMHGGNRFIDNGEVIIIDAANATVLIDPEQQVIAEYEQRRRAAWRRLRRLVSIKSQRTQSIDGEPVSLLANIELASDLRKVRQVDAAGVGLYRTEFMFLNREHPPEEEEQFNAYAEAVSKLQRPVTIRTLDIGADKPMQTSDGTATAATNPALGLRGIRLCLSRPDLFMPQIRAILRASAFGKVEIMFPMICALDELDQVLDMIDQAKIELNHEGVDYDRDIKIGGMIEVPAAAITADLFAARLDFLSIGTNDLIQYTLAVDRIDDDVTYLYDPLHPAVLRLVQGVIDAGRRADKPVTMCGEMAGDTLYTRLLLGLGLRNFSMDPRRLLQVKQLVVTSRLKPLSEIVGDTLSRCDAAELRALLTTINEDVALH